MDRWECADIEAEEANLRATRIITRVASSILLAGSVARQPWRACALMLVPTLGLTLAVTPSIEARTFKVLYAFKGYPIDGDGPVGGLLMDASGNLYGNTLQGGNVDHRYCDQGRLGCGTVFKLGTNGKEVVLYNFTGAGDGASPEGSPVMDSQGNLYGVARFGGDMRCSDLGTGCGVVFKLSARRDGPRRLTVLHRFTGGGDGAEPWGGLAIDAAGTLYGTTTLGGDLNCAGGFGCGVVFKLAGKKLTVLHRFTGGKDGALAYGGLVIDAQDNLYGTTQQGGSKHGACQNGGCGVVFKFAGNKERVLHAFQGNPDGAGPYIGRLLRDAHGNLYGTTGGGGRGEAAAGTVFKVGRYGKEKVLHSFQPQQGDGWEPDGGLVQDAEGNLYGATESGGTNNAGILFKISKYGRYTVVHNFCSGNCDDGLYPFGDLIMDGAGNIYGTSSAGGGTHGKGVVFRYTP